MRRKHYRAQPMFRRGDLTRLMSMLLVLAVLFTIITRLRNNPGMLAGLFPDNEDQQYVRHASSPSDAKTPIAAAAPGEASAALPGAAKPAAEPAAPEETPPDLDPEERDAIQEEFQAVADGQKFLDKSEMPAYHRLARWAKAQTFEAMRKRATKRLVYTQYFQNPSEIRGTLVAMRIDVRRILEHPPVADPDDDARKITFYELWGFTEESKTFPYCVVVEDMPEGMPIGANVQEYVQFVGYFFALQGYDSARSKPDSQRLQAPMLIGRVKWDKPAPMPLTNADYSIIIIVAAAIGLIALVTITMSVFRGRRGFLETANRSAPGALTVDDWLGRAEQGEAPGDLGDDAEDFSFPSDTRRRPDGHDHQTPRN